MKNYILIVLISFISIINFSFIKGNSSENLNQAGSAIGNLVWEDMNGNGIQEIGEPGIEGVEIRLIRLIDSVVYITYSNVNGNYLFDSTNSVLNPGEYQLRFIKPASYYFTYLDMGTDDQDSDADKTGNTIQFSLEVNEENFDMDAGLYIPCRIGDYVWRDYNTNGIQDTSDFPLSNVEVRLFSVVDGTMIDFTFSDNEGFYEFYNPNVRPGEYYVQFSLLPTFLYTGQNMGSEEVDSDPDEVTGNTPNFSIMSGADTTFIDAGFFVIPPNDCPTENTFGECDLAPTLCKLEDLNNFCTSMVNQWQQTPIPGCSYAIFFHNPSWLAFVAGASEMNIIIHAAPCVIGTGALGIQWGIYEDCDLQNPILLQCYCVEPGDIQIELSGLTIGETYQFFIDGCSGTQCTFWIEILEGGVLPEIHGPENIICDEFQGCGNIFKGDSVSFLMENLNNATSYIWEVNEVEVSVTDTPFVTLFFEYQGDYEICGYGKNDCQIADDQKICLEFAVQGGDCDSITLDVTQDSILCYGYCDGSISIDNVRKGNPPYSYLWSTGDSTSFINNLCPGIFSVTIEDDSSCLVIEEFTIIENDELFANAISTDESGLNTKDGKASAYPTGGLSPYSYLWNNDSTSQTIIGLSPDQYIVTVSDSIQCTDIDTVIVDEFICSGLEINSQVIDVTCFNDCDGAIAILSLENGIPPVVYSWNTGSNSPLINNLCAGIYTVTLTDSIGCSIIDSFVISQPNEIIVSVDTAINITSNGLGAIFISTNDDGSFLYQWSGPNGYSNINEDIKNLTQGGCYTLLITDTITNCILDTIICINDNTGLIEQNWISSKIKVFPNPSSNNIFISFNETNIIKAQIEVYSLSGKSYLKTTKTISDEMISLDVNEINPGLYFIKITNEKGSYYKKIVIVR